MSYYKTINGVTMDDKLLKQGKNLSLNDPNLNLHIKILLESAMDANKLTATEINTLEYINQNVLNNSDTMLRTVLKMITLNNKKPAIIEAQPERWDYSRP
tara:strand:- start:355 stop:654 length:300 start_codon:yes stop_codon:yes gene_type:complete